ncbi:class III signal peptide-containing protein [Candidatus Micrarchaeota archaeon]|nr:class III signal peptide-containing protein [Candidatus Micrarchaeota archaeon]
MNEKRGQNTFEYILILTAAIMLVALTTYFLMNGIFAPQSEKLDNQSAQIKDFKKQLQDQGGSGAPGASVSPQPPP